jgi:outer membrane assembly lipoprotein YfgL
MTSAVRRRCTSLIALGALLLASCQSLPSWMTSFPTIPPPSLSWLGLGRDTHKPGPLPTYDAKVTPRVEWQVPLGAKGGQSFAPAVRSDAIYAASPDGTIVSVDPASGRQIWRIKAERPLSAGVGAQPGVVVVGTAKGDVIAFDSTGKTLWQVKVSTEVSGPPKAADGKVVVWALDGRIYGLSDADGSQKWVYTRTNPPLTVRRFAGGTVSRGALFTGTAGGRLLALDIATGALGWEASVATPKGATELERIADVTSAPIVEERQACAAAFQGRVACFDIVRGTLIWSRDFSSLGGIAVTAATSTPPTTRAPYTRSTSRPARRSGSRTSSLLAFPADRSSSASTSVSSTARVICTCSTAMTAIWSAASPPTAPPRCRSP